MTSVSFEGLSIEDVLEFSDKEMEGLVFSQDALVLNIGSSRILGQFKRTETRLVLELAQIDGGGEGVLPALGALASRYAKKQGLKEIEWQVHAINCAEPNQKLRRLLERRKFEIKNVEGVGDVFHKIVPTG